MKLTELMLKEDDATKEVLAWIGTWCDGVIKEHDVEIGDTFTANEPNLNKLFHVIQHMYQEMDYVNKLEYGGITMQYEDERPDEDDWDDDEDNESSRDNPDVSVDVTFTMGKEKLFSCSFDIEGVDYQDIWYYGDVDKNSFRMTPSVYWREARKLLSGGGGLTDLIAADDDSEAAKAIRDKLARRSGDKLDKAGLSARAKEEAAKAAADKLKSLKK